MEISALDIFVGKFAGYKVTLGISKGFGATFIQNTW